MIEAEITEKTYQQLQNDLQAIYRDPVGSDPQNSAAGEILEQLDLLDGLVHQGVVYNPTAEDFLAWEKTEEEELLAPIRALAKMGSALRKGKYKRTHSW